MSKKKEFGGWGLLSDLKHTLKFIFFNLTFIFEGERERERETIQVRGRERRQEDMKHVLC